jgi:hypothetical protein
VKTEFGRDISISVETAKPMGYLKPKTKTKEGFGIGFGINCSL